MGLHSSGKSFRGPYRGSGGPVGIDVDEGRLKKIIVEGDAGILNEYTKEKAKFLSLDLMNDEALILHYQKVEIAHN